MHCFPSSWQQKWVQGGQVCRQPGRWHLKEPFCQGSYMGFLSLTGNLNCAQAFTPETVLRAATPGLALVVAYGACARLIVSGPQTMFSWHMSFLIIGLLSGTHCCAFCLTPSSTEGRGHSLGGQSLAKATSSGPPRLAPGGFAGVKRLPCTKPLPLDSFLESEIRAAC